MTEKLTLETAIAHRSFGVAGKPDEKVDVLIGKPELCGDSLSDTFARCGHGANQAAAWQ